MFLVHVVLTLALAVSDQPSSEHGVIRGRVVNRSRSDAPCGQTEVILRARVEGEFAPVAQTLTDADGNYRFEGLPVGADYLYLPGANREGIHYPGRRVGLTRGQPTAFVTLEVRDTIEEPSPLAVRQHEIVIVTEGSAIHVAEALLVDNPTTATYVGRAENAGSEPVTLQLHIPSDFERVTFEKERFGSQFQVVNGRLVTGIPWTPGRQWLKYTYTLRANAVPGIWRRALDAPCESLRVRVKHSEAETIGCNLPPVAESPQGEKVFQSSADVLPAGHEIRVQLGHPPASWSVYGRWVALLTLLGLIVGAAVVVGGTRRRARSAQEEVSAAVRTYEVRGRRSRGRDRPRRAA